MHWWWCVFSLHNPFLTRNLADHRFPSNHSIRWWLLNLIIINLWLYSKLLPFNTSQEANSSFSTLCIPRHLSLIWVVWSCTCWPNITANSRVWMLEIDCNHPIISNFINHHVVKNTTLSHNLSFWILLWYSPSFTQYIPRKCFCRCL